MDAFLTRAVSFYSASPAPATAWAAGLIAEAMANGQGGRYTFTYFPGERRADGSINSYTLSARPMGECRDAGLPSYFTDESGVIRVTHANRAATVNDPPLEK